MEQNHCNFNFFSFRVKVTPAYTTYTTIGTNISIDSWTADWCSQAVSAVSLWKQFKFMLSTANKGPKFDSESDGYSTDMVF